MTDESGPEAFVAGRLRANAARTRRLVGRPEVITRLDGADFLSLTALLFAWTGAVLLVSGEPNWGVIVVLVGFLFDKLDGYYARRRGLTTEFGRQLDAFVDVFAYLLSGALLFHVTMSPTPTVSVLVGFALVGFGGLRLIRFTSEGFRSEDGTSYYRGLTVVHANIVVLANYLLYSFLGVWNGWVAAAAIAFACPLMISEYKSYKTVRSQAVAGLAGLVVAGLCLFLEFGPEVSVLG